MSWKVNFGDGKSVEFDKLTIDFFEPIAARDKSLSAYGIYLQPIGGSPGRAHRVVAACAALVGVEPPAPPASEELGELKQYTGFFEWLDEGIEDQPMGDGLPTTPGEPDSGSSPTSPGGTDGPTTSVDDNPSNIS